ncbi:hypothetical protein P9112_000399 [Eukaryota sp. TZLM1-RC]
MDQLDEQINEQIVEENREMDQLDEQINEQIVEENREMDQLDEQIDEQINEQIVEENREMDQLDEQINEQIVEENREMDQLDEQIVEENREMDQLDEQLDEQIVEENREMDQLDEQIDEQINENFDIFLSFALDLISSLFNQNSSKSNQFSELLFTNLDNNLEKIDLGSIKSVSDLIGFLSGLIDLLVRYSNFESFGENFSLPDKLVSEKQLAKIAGENLKLKNLVLTTLVQSITTIINQCPVKFASLILINVCLKFSSVVRSIETSPMYCVRKTKFSAKFSEANFDLTELASHTSTPQIFVLFSHCQNLVDTLVVRIKTSFLTSEILDFKFLEEILLLLDSYCELILSENILLPQDLSQNLPRIAEHNVIGKILKVLSSSCPKFIISDYSNINRWIQSNLD